MPAPSHTTNSSLSRWWPFLLLPFLHVAAAVPLIFLHINRSRGAYDSVNYHEKMIRDFIAQWPRPDFHDYLSVTTPLYHVLLAAVGRYLSDSIVVLKLAGMTFTLALLGLLVWGCTRPSRDRSAAWQAVANVLPVAACVYVFSAGVWLLPDNAGWLGCVAILLLALRPRFDWVTVAAGGGILLLLVLTRQIHLWAATPLVVAAWIGPLDGKNRVGGGGRGGGVPPPPSPPPHTPHTPHPTPALWGHWPARLRRAAIMLAATLPAIAALGYFVNLWGGLTPPSFRDWFRQPYNAATPAFILMLFGLYGTFFAPTLLPPLARLARRRRATLLLALAAALLVCMLPPTSRDPFEGRYSGLWEQLIARAPTIRDRSPVVIGLGVLGAAWLAAAFAAIAVRQRLILMASLAGFVAAQTASFWVWQRYSEPMVLIFLALLASAAGRERPPATALHRRLALAGPAALAGVLGAITLATVALSGVAQDEGFRPGQLQPPPLRPAGPAPTMP